MQVQGGKPAACQILYRYGEDAQPALVWGPHLRHQQDIHGSRYHNGISSHLIPSSPSSSSHPHIRIRPDLPNANSTLIIRLEIFRSEGIAHQTAGGFARCTVSSPRRDHRPPSLFGIHDIKMRPERQDRARRSPIAAVSCAIHLLIGIDYMRQNVPNRQSQLSTNIE